MRWTRFVMALGRVGRWHVAWLIVSIIALEWVVSVGFRAIRDPGVRRSEMVLFMMLLTAPFVEETIRWAIGVGRSGDNRSQGLIWFTTIIVVVELLAAPFSLVEPLQKHSALVITAAILVLRAPATALHIVNSWLVSRYADRAAKGPSFAPFATIGIHAAINAFAVLFWLRAVVGFVQRV